MAEDYGPPEPLEHASRRCYRRRPCGTRLALASGVASAACPRQSRRMGRHVEPQTIESRVESLEKRVGSLEELPHRIDDLTSQILLLRGDLGSAKTSIRETAAGIVTQLRGEMRESADAVVTQLRGEMRESADAVVTQLRGEMRDMREGLVIQIRDEIGEMHALAMKEVLSGQDKILVRLDLVLERLPPRR
jgi:dsDNA-specific endonuclease/ATPase MutS2